MNRNEKRELLSTLLCTYEGILFNNNLVDNNLIPKITYDFNCKEYEILRKKYNIQAICGKGSDFAKAKRLVHNFSDRLQHLSDYDNHIDQNAISLLDYSLDNPDHGINCLNKSKIIEECLLSQGIFARRVVLKPYSPYDLDNHVVNEIYDRKLKKWIMLDVTTDGYFIDQDKNPLSILEIRNLFASQQFVTFVKTKEKLNDLEKIKYRHLDKNVYICKNMGYFIVEESQKFGLSDKKYIIAPSKYSYTLNAIKNYEFKIKIMPEYYKKEKEWMEKQIKALKNNEDDYCSYKTLLMPPLE